MTPLAPRSLRVRLAALGLVGVLIPLLLLLAVSMVSDETQSQTIDDDGQTTDGQLTERTRGLSPWVPATAALLAVPAGLAAWWWAGRAVAPLERITAVADEIQATSLDRRIGELDAPDEVQALADSFDRMLDRLAAASDVQRRLLEDASHELRTPLAVLATNAQVALADPRPDVDELRRAMRATKETVDQLGAVIDDLLADARADHHAAAGVGNDLVGIAERAVATYRAAADGRDVELRLEAPDQLLAAVDGPPVARAVASLVDNAVRHSPPGGVVDMTVGLDERRAFVRVADQGPGIDREHRAQIFERYWTGDPAPEGAEHFGIGLAVVKQVGDAHDGVEVESPLGPTGGTRFTLRFRT
jgi:two-component system OmpR family sensor kinase